VTEAGRELEPIGLAAPAPALSAADGAVDFLAPRLFALIDSWPVAAEDESARARRDVRYCEWPV